MKTILISLFFALIIHQLNYAQQGGTLGFEFPSVVKFQNSSNNSENIYLFNYEGKSLKALQFKIRIENSENQLQIKSLTNGLDIPKSGFLFDYEIHNLLDENGKPIIKINAVILGNGYNILEQGDNYHLASINFNIDNNMFDISLIKFSLIDVMGTTSSPVEDANIVAGDDLDLMIKQNSEVVKSVTLNQNYPNPFNPVTTIKYSIPENEENGFQKIVLQVYDALGNQITTLVNDTKAAGNYEVQFDAQFLSSGIYFYTINSGKTFVSKKMILMK